MAIQPLDLQPLFTQLDQIGKAQAGQREGLQLQATLQDTQMQKKTDQAVKTVREAGNEQAGLQAVDERERRRQGRGPGYGKDGKDGKKREETEKEPVVLRDPALGNHLDISG